MNRLIKVFLTRPLMQIPKFTYIDEKHIQLRDEKSGYYMNPEDVARRFIKVLALHDDIKNPEKINLNTTFHELGLNDMTYVEVMVEIEREFEFEMPDEAVESFRNINDAVEYIARSFFTA